VTQVLQSELAMPAERAARLAGVSARQLAYWESKGLLRPSIVLRLGPRSNVRLYSFTDLLQLLVVAELRGYYPLQQIRRLIEHMRSRGYSEPLRELRFSRLGKEIFVQHPDGAWEGDLQPDQIVFEHVVRLGPLAQRVWQEAGRSESQVGAIERRRGRLGSKPVFAGTRIPVETVRQYLERGYSTAAVIEAFPTLTPQDVDAARQKQPLPA
jgi:DNA-binding transcriptional MerR regulator